MGSYCIENTSLDAMTKNRLMLTRDELVELTQYAQRAKQRKRLIELGIPFIAGRKGDPLVVRQVFEQLQSAAKRKKVVPPDFGALTRI